MVDAILRCPKCHAGMMSSRRDGVVLDQCAGCRGIFLDERELIRLIESIATLPPKPSYAGRHRRV